MILCCGGALIDFVPMAGAGGEAGYLPCPGGSTFNTAIGLARLEVPTGFFGRLSTDPFGDRLLAALRDSGVRTEFVVRGNEPTRLGFVVFPEGQAEPRYTFHASDTADRNLRPDDLPPALPDDVEALHFGSIYMVLEPVAGTLEEMMRREAGRRVISIDPNVRPTLIADMPAYRDRFENRLSHVDIAKASLADIGWLYPGITASDVMARWLGLGPALVVVTRGAGGACAATAAATADVPGRRVEVTDTVGAGDSFQAALIAWLWTEGLLRRERLRALGEPALATALAYACRAAAITCTRKGADPPTRRDVDGAEPDPGAPSRR